MDTGEDAGAVVGDTWPAVPVHVWPFHRRIRVWPLAVLPTAQALVAEVAATPVS